MIVWGPEVTKILDEGSLLAATVKNPENSGFRTVVLAGIIFFEKWRLTYILLTFRCRKNRKNFIGCSNGKELGLPIRQSYITRRYCWILRICEVYGVEESF